MPGLFLEEVHPPLGFELRDQPVAHIEEDARGDEHHHALEDLAHRAPMRRSPGRSRPAAVARLARTARPTPHQMALAARPRVPRRSQACGRAGCRADLGSELVCAPVAEAALATSASSMVTTRMTSTPSRRIVTSDARNAGPNAPAGGLRAWRSRSRLASTGRRPGPPVLLP